MYKIIKDKRFIFGAILLLIILGIAFFWFWREAVFSKQILKLEILGPDLAKAGDEITYTIKYKNNGNFVLEKPKLIFELPENSLNEDSKTRFTEDLEDIYPGEESAKEFKGRIFGKEGDVKKAKATLTYIPKNLSARYESDTILATKIEAVPLTLTYDMPTNVEKGKEITYSINYFSNIEYPLENLSIKIDPVEGFNFKSATPSSLDNTEWKLSTLNKGQGGRITINGLVNSETGGHLNFSAKIGIWQDGSFIVLKETNQEMIITQPRLLISQSINGSPDYSASPGETLNYQISFQNVGSTSFSNLFATVNLDGKAYDFSTLQSSIGQVDQNGRAVVFSPSQVSQLKNLYPQQKVNVNFSVKLKESLPDSSSQTIKSFVNVLDINQEFVTKVSSQLNFSQKAYRSSTNGIDNFGPIPPKVGESTSYNIVWSVQNATSNLKNVRVKAVLPQNVSLVDSLYPESEASNLSFDSLSRQLVWLAGDLSENASKTLTIQIVLQPVSFQVGTAPSIIGQATVFAEDQFTGATIQKTVSAVNTTLPDDQSSSGGGVVQ